MNYPPIKTTFGGGRNSGSFQHAPQNRYSKQLSHCGFLKWASNQDLKEGTLSDEHFKLSDRLKFFFQSSPVLQSKAAASLLHTFFPFISGFWILWYLAPNTMFNFDPALNIRARTRLTRLLKTQGRQANPVVSAQKRYKKGNRKCKHWKYLEGTQGTARRN